MKNIVDKLQQKNVICKQLTPVPPKELGSRKRIRLYLGVDTHGYYCSAIVLAKKSRVLRKEVEELITLHARLEQHADTRITKKYLSVEAPLCSKAKAMMEQAGWVLL